MDFRISVAGLLEWRCSTRLVAQTIGESPQSRPGVTPWKNSVADSRWAYLNERSVFWSPLKRIFSWGFSGLSRSYWTDSDSDFVTVEISHHGFIGTGWKKHRLTLLFTLVQSFSLVFIVRHQITQERPKICLSTLRFRQRRPELVLEGSSRIVAGVSNHSYTHIYIANLSDRYSYL